MKMGNDVAASERRTVLENISWQRYEAVLRELRSRRTARLTYQRGRMEMMTPLEAHIRYTKAIESLVLTLTDALGLRVEGYRTPTLRRHDLQLGTEPDAGFYLQHESAVRGQATVDLMTDPPPDIVFEVELSRSTLNKFAIYQHLQIPEIWRFISQPNQPLTQARLFIHYLDGDRYLEDDYGLAFPFLPANQILHFLRESETDGLMAALRALQQWLSDHQIGEPN